MQSVWSADPIIALECSGHARHAASEVAPGVPENVRGGQSVHKASPGCGLKLPTSQGEHGAPFGAVCPGMHVQLVTRPLPSGEEELAGQPRQRSGESAPSSGE
jgi:hypothetical protein